MAEYKNEALRLAEYLPVLRWDELYGRWEEYNNDFRCYPGLTPPGVWVVTARYGFDAAGECTRKEFPDERSALQFLCGYLTHRAALLSSEYHRSARGVGT